MDRLGTASPTALLEHRQGRRQPGNLNSRTLSNQDIQRPTKRLAPGLELRLRRLHDQKRVHDRDAARRSIGRIPEAQLAEIERLQRRRATQEAATVRRRVSAGSTWTMPGGVRLSGGPVSEDNDHEASSVFGSDDVSSVIDISDSLAPSETDDDRDELRDSNKYRFEDVGKTRLKLHTKEPLSPSSQPVPPSAIALPRPRSSTPTTPTTHIPADTQPLPFIFPSPAPSHSPAPASSPMAYGPDSWVNGGAEHGSDSDVIRPSQSRANSVYTLGRASFTGQLAQLTSMRLPDGNSLAKRISSIPTSTEAAKALTDVSEQICMWISKASDVLDGLKAEDDVEWAAAGGREGMEEVDNAIKRFQQLVEVYILSIERLQTREDIALLTVDEINASERQLETIIVSWQQIRDTLNDIKKQVEIAVEWEQLWNTVFGEIAQEMDGLNRLVFEMEERRHTGADNLLSPKDNIDLSELETIIEDQPGRQKAAINRFSIGPISLGSPLQVNDIKEDSSLLALFARMQPLRASLEFLPMRLSTWQFRGKDVFPSACLDLDHRQAQLETQWSKLEADAESLRRELGEDRWVLVFRNAGRQALKMCESITRSCQKLRDAIDGNERQISTADLHDKIENYGAKKRHYGPAIKRVLAIIDRGVLDRLTLNGEILRLQSEMKQRWTCLQNEMDEMDLVVEEINVERWDKGLRDSVSTVISSERSVGSSMVDTPGTSPASSVVGASRADSLVPSTPTPLINVKTSNSTSKPNGRLSVSSSLPRRTLVQRKSYSDMQTSARSASSLPTPSKTPVWPSRPDPLPLNNRPRWQNAIKPEPHDFRPLSAFEPSPYAKTPVTPRRSYLPSHATPSSALGSRTPVQRNFSAPSPQPSSIPAPIASAPRGLRNVSLPVPASTAGRQLSPLRSKASAPALSTSVRPPSRLVSASGRKSSMLHKFTDGNDADNESPAHHHRRPPSAMNGGRLGVGLNGAGRAVSRLGQTTVDSRPKWRP